jgi:protein-tyrosine phosphatase
MIDLHSHILFGLDDGPATVEGSLELARSAVETGTTTMVATPHIDWRWGVAPTDIAARAAELEEELRLAEIDLGVLTGGEVAIDRYLDLAADELELLTLGKGPYLLLECPLSLVAGSMDLVVTSILHAGHNVLLAHPERCPVFQRQPDALRDLVRAGALCQLTAESLTGRFGRNVRQFSIALLRDGLVHDLASDAHDDQTRPPQLLDGLLELRRELPGVEAQAEWLTRDAPAAILAGTPLPPRPPLRSPTRRGIFRRS